MRVRQLEKEYWEVVSASHPDQTRRPTPFQFFQTLRTLQQGGRAGNAARLAKTPLLLTNGVTTSRESVLRREFLDPKVQAFIDDFLPRTWMLASLSMKSVFFCAHGEASARAL